MSSETEAQSGQESPAGSAPLPDISADSLKYSSLPGSLEQSLQTWLGNNVLVGKERKRKTDVDPSYYNTDCYSHVVTPTTWQELRKGFVAKLGSDFFTVDLHSMEDAQFTKDDVHKECTTTVLTADLRLADSLPYEVFEEGLTRLLVDESKFDMLVGSKLARKCGIKQGKPVRVNDKRLLNLIPEMQYVHDICGSYFVPKDHYFLLLSVPVEHRRFLTLCFDRAKEQGVQPFNVPLEVSGKNSEHNDILLVKGYALIMEEVRAMVEYGLLSAQTMLDVAPKVGVADIAPYMKSVQQLAKKLKQ